MTLGAESRTRASNGNHPNTHLCLPRRSLSRMCGAWCRMRPIMKTSGRRTPWTLPALAAFATGATPASAASRVPRQLRERAWATGQVRVLVGLKSASPEAAKPRCRRLARERPRLRIHPVSCDGGHTGGSRRLRDDGWGRPRGRRRAVPAAARRQHADRECRGGVDPGIHGAGWTVAILDTGVDKSHPFLAGKVVSQACFSFQGKLPQRQQPPDWRRGSLLVCPTFLRSRHSRGRDRGRLGPTFSGVAKDATIIAVQIFSMFTGPDCYGAGEDPCAYTSTSDIVKALEYVYSL